MLTEDIEHEENSMVVREGKGRIDLEDCLSLFDFIKHGDTKHRLWLMRAIVAWSARADKPEIQ